MAFSGQASTHFGFLQNTHLIIFGFPFFSPILIRGISFNPLSAASDTLVASLCLIPHAFSQEWHVTHNLAVKRTRLKFFTSDNWHLLASLGMP